MSAELNVENLRKQAKTLHKGATAGDNDSVARARKGLPRLSDMPARQVPEAGVTLQEMQHVIAVEQGFSHWKQLLQAAGAPRRKKRRTPLHVRPNQQTAQQEAEWLLWMVRRGEGWSLDRLRQGLPRVAQMSAQEMAAANVTLDEIRLVVASDYGYDDWAQLEADLGQQSAVQVFEDLAGFDDDDIRLVITRMGRDKLALVLKNASEALLARFRGNMDDGEWQALQRAIEGLGPMPLSVVEAAQGRLLQQYRTNDPLV